MWSESARGRCGRSSGLARCVLPTVSKGGMTPRLDTPRHTRVVSTLAAVIDEIQVSLYV